MFRVSTPQFSVIDIDLLLYLPAHSSGFILPITLVRGRSGLVTHAPLPKPAPETRREKVSIPPRVPTTNHQ